MQLEFSVVYEAGHDGWVIARVPELPGAVTQGRTREEAREMIGDAVRLLLEAYRDRARQAASAGAVWETILVDLPAA